MGRVSRNLGDSAGSLPPQATRVARTGWRDPRLWIGLLLLSASVLGGARLLASADATEPVWAVSVAGGAGTVLDPADLEVQRVRFADAADLDRYFSADTDLPADLVLNRTVEAGELLPRTAVGSAADSELVELSLEVAPNAVPPSVTTGAVIDVYVDDRSARASGRAGGGSGEGKALSEVTVVAAPLAEETFAVSGFRQVVVAVPEADAEEFQALLASLEEPVLSLVKH